MASSEVLYYASMAMQFSVLLPILIGIRRWLFLDRFGKFIFYSLSLALVSDILGTVSAYTFKTNFLIYTAYDFLYTVLYGMAWYYLREYDKRDKRIIQLLTAITLVLMAVFFFFGYNMSVNGVVSLLFSMTLGLLYYYNKIVKIQIVDSLVESKFVIASASIFFCLSSLIIYVAYNFVPRDQIPYIWTLKQLFYMLFNVLIAISFYLYRKQIQYI